MIGLFVLGVALEELNLLLFTVSGFIEEISQVILDD
jgi:hypothetical protein